MSSNHAPLTVAGLATALDERIPHSWAEPWDQVGLIAGDPNAVITGVLVTLDATGQACERAKRCGANVVVSHHPPFLTPPAHILPGAGPAGALEAALRLGISLMCLHTNFDRSPEGACALPNALGLSICGPLESAPEPVSVVRAFVPENAAEAVREAMSAAGAGHLGDYAECAFISNGIGHFKPLSDAWRCSAGPITDTQEQCVEVVTARDNVKCVLAAARAQHPYNEPVIVSFEATRARSSVCLGRLCAWGDGQATVQALAQHTSAILGVDVRVWGDLSRPCGQIAVVGGSAGSLVPDALASAQTLVAGEVHYHDACEAVAAGLAIIEAGHDATEWPLVSALGKVVDECVGSGVLVNTECPKFVWHTVRETNE